MEANTRVKIDGLKSRTDLNGREGVALYYVPPSSKAATQGRYLVEVDGSDGERLGIKLENLAVRDHSEDHGKKSDDIITVNGLTYCKPHRMEICGECGMDFRLMNRMRQLEPGEDVYDRAVKVDEEEGKRGERPQQAMSKVRPVASVQEPTLNSKAAPPRGLDPSTLPAWPRDLSPVSGSKGHLELAFQQAFSMQEMFQSHAGGKPTPESNPLYHVKESLLCIAQRCDERFRDKLPVPRFALQDEAQTEVIFIDVIDVRIVDEDRSRMTDSPGTPLFIVRWAYYTAGSMRTFIDGIQASMKMKLDADRASGFSKKKAEKAGSQNMPSHPAEIALAKCVLETNGKRLDPTFVQKASEGLVEGWRVSCFQPITKEAEKKPETAKEICAKCGEAGGSRTLLTCARCKVQKYCSKECQVADWKAHKKCCKAPEKEAAAEIINVDLSVNLYAARGMPDMHMSVMSNQQSMSRAFSSSNARPIIAAAEGSLPPADKMFIVKIQVPLVPGDDLMCYNEKRDIQTQIGAENCRGLRRLDQVIRSGNVAGGMKAYFHAYISIANELHVLAHKPLPLQPW